MIVIGDDHVKYATREIEARRYGNRDENKDRLTSTIANSPPPGRHDGDGRFSWKEVAWEDLHQLFYMGIQ